MLDEFLRTHFKPEQIVLTGKSMGGYFAPRAAAFDDRIDDVVAEVVLGASEDQHVLADPVGDGGQPEGQCRECNDPDLQPRLRPRPNAAIFDWVRKMFAGDR